MIVLDANMLMRAVLGKGARRLVFEYGDRIVLATPETAVQEARTHLPGVIARRRLDAAASLALLAVFASLQRVLRIVQAEQYSEFETVARTRMRRRDEADWPVLATAMALDCPIWTEDADFFGCGVATWTTDRVETYLAAQVSE